MSTLDDLRRRFQQARVEAPEPFPGKPADATAVLYMGRHTGPGHSIAWSMAEVSSWTKTFHVRSKGGSPNAGQFVYDLVFINGALEYHSGGGTGKTLTELSLEGLRRVYKQYKGRPEATCIAILVKRIAQARFTDIAPDNLDEFLNH